MTRLFITIVLAGLLSACGSSPILTRDKPVVVVPSSEMLSCSTVEDLPDPNTLTDLQVAKLVVELKTKLDVCANKMREVEQFLLKAKRKLES